MRSIIQKDKVCYICGHRGVVEDHHIFGGYNRPKSEKYGLKVFLCPECHRGQNGVHNNKRVMQWLREVGQISFYSAYPELNFAEIFGKNYLSGFER